MKTAEEWHHTEKFLKNQPNAVPCNCVSCQHIRAVQLDAWKQGMSNAADLAENILEGEWPWIHSRIRDARDAKKELP